MPTGLWGCEGRVPAYGRFMADSRASLRGFCASRQVSPSPFLVPAAPWRALPNIPGKPIVEPLGTPLPGGGYPKMGAGPKYSLG